MALPVRVTRQQPARWDPFREFEELSQRLNQLWENMLGGWPTLERWSPLADVEETDDAYTVEIDLPGVRREDVTVELVDGELRVSGEVKEKERRGIVRRQTRRTGRFDYVVQFPGEIDADQVTARLSDGVLTVRLPKAATAKPRRIEISA
ncbi:MAG: Hsp20/alpha crystallin family protein [Acidothermus sp.]|nr:Hsp20/alpha crystallin family protein [Acidothermus sp.]MCL6538057.1 Hsp20/alpha crystallin family protein [Acidothermus sp.]